MVDDDPANAAVGVTMIEDYNLPILVPALFVPDMRRVLGEVTGVARVMSHIIPVAAPAHNIREEGACRLTACALRSSQLRSMLKLD